VKTARILAVAVLILLLAAIFIFIFARPSDPVYKGKRLSIWLAEAHTGGWPRHAPVEADEAIRQIGTDSFPMIRHLLRSRDSEWTRSWRRTLYRVPVLGSIWGSPPDDHGRAIAACYALGTVAKPLIPDLAEALPHLGVQPFAEQWLGSMGSEAEAAIPSLISILKDKNNSLRMFAAQNLARIAIRRPNDVIPIFRECSKETNTMVVNEVTAAWAILSERESDEDRK
jgi:hypothetical protein